MSEVLSNGIRPGKARRASPHYTRKEWWEQLDQTARGIRHARRLVRGILLLYFWGSLGIGAFITWGIFWHSPILASVCALGSIANVGVTGIVLHYVQELQRGCATLLELSKRAENL